MKIQVRDDKGKPLGAIKIKVIDLDSKAAAKQSGAWHKIERLLLKSLSSSHKNTPGIKTKNSKPEVKTLEIKISLPDFRRLPKPRQAAQSLRQASRRTLALMLLSLIVIVVGGFALLSGPTKQPAAADSAGAKTPQLVRGSPKFTTILPSGKTINQLGGWARVSPPNRDPVYAYADKIGTVRIDVSEQPLPPKFVADTENQVAQLAQNFNATEKFSATGTTVYLATSSDGSQSVILAKNDLLILISSTAALTNNQWAGYINALH